MPARSRRRCPEGRPRILLLALGGALLAAGAWWARARLWVPDEQTLARMRVAELVTLARRHPGSEPVYFTLGMRLMDAGRPYEAATAFEQATVNDPRSARSLEGAARVLAANQQLEDAANHFLWSLRVDPERSSARQALAILYQSIAAWPQAAEQWEWLAERRPAEAETWFRLGQCRARAGRGAAGIAALRRSVELAPGHEPYAAELRWVLNQTSAGAGR